MYKTMFKDRKTHVFKKCPQCKAMIRLPKRKGSHEVICPKCGREFKIKCSKKLGYVEVMNSEVLYLADKPESFSGADFIMLNFCDESPAEVRKIISAYKYSSDKKPENLTRGLYFRGVL